MDQENNFNQQNWNQFQQQPRQPQRKSNAWKIWLGVTLGVLLIISVLVYYAVQIGKKMGDNMQDNLGKAMSMMDSTANATNDTLYYGIYNNLGNDSVSQIYKQGLKEVKSLNDSIEQMLAMYYNGFKDTLGDQGTMKMLDRRWSESYFIKTGRAKRLKNALIFYREKLIYDLPKAQQDSSLRLLMMIDEMQNAMPGFMKKLGNWENMYFNQPPANVKLSFTTIRMEINSFEKEILRRWQNAIAEIPEN